MQYVDRSEGAPIPKARALGAILAAQSGLLVDDIAFMDPGPPKIFLENFYRISSNYINDFTNITLNQQPNHLLRIVQKFDK
ncbi:unnamed protein product [Cunninghamella echinulata]